MIDKFGSSIHRSDPVFGSTDYPYFNLNRSKNIRLKLKKKKSTKSLIRRRGGLSIRKSYLPNISFRMKYISQVEFASPVIRLKKIPEN